MADTAEKRAIPAPPFTDLGQCTSTELCAYEAELRDTLKKARTDTYRIRVLQRLADVEAQWEARENIMPGRAGAAWRFH